jgi:hypothetical protein
MLTNNQLNRYNFSFIIDFNGLGKFCCLSLKDI